MREKLQTDYVLMMRTHYLIADQLDFSAYEGFVRDFSNYEDIRDLYLMADLLITDYSSVFFDYANLRRPIVFFTYDIEDYRDHLRGFYFDFEKEAPGPIVRTTDEVIREVRKSETEDFTATPQYANFLKRFCALEDGHAAERVVHQAFGKR
jgi:CDP-glycerol glycerophosphotransferase